MRRNHKPWHSHDILLQVAAVKAELALVQAQLMNNHYAAVPGSDQQHHQQPQFHLSSHRHPNAPTTLQPAYSNNSSTTSNIINMGSFAPGFDIPAASSSHNLENLRFSPRKEEEEEEENQIPPAFAADFLRR
ncbi:hypothetical protein MLD38_033248 [Melastoma candidum]|uniref:Uncharacterized protein n=1 Tax=Melastoma candidum TaxID=119954 RepID=A0ACB9M696_9MYRT|nr:hypothetical protein MLD38_033248 [Melastoma candidum]